MIKLKDILNEGKWNHNTVGKQGSISKYTDGMQSVSFELNKKKQMWQYTATLSRDDKASGYSSGTTTKVLPEKYQDMFDEGDTKKMTYVANQIIKGNFKNESINEATNPKSIHASYIERNGKLYSIKVDGKKVDNSEIKKTYSISIANRYDESDLKKITNQFKKQGIKFTYDDSMDVS
jgi:hypothetical protein